MINPRKKSKYWVDDNSILPEIIITPQGNYPILDEAGNPARTVGAIQDINPNAHIYERVNTQPFMDDYIEGETNAAANQRADVLDATVVPHMGDFVSAATKPLDVLMPSRWVGLLDKDYDGLSAVDRFSRLFDENNRGLFINDKPYGLFSKRYAEEHPYWAMAGNTAFDIASTPFIWNGANKAYNAGKTVYNTGRNAVRNYNFAKALDSDIANTKLNIEEPLFTKLNVPMYNRVIIPNSDNKLESLVFFERPKSKISVAERFGIPKGERNSMSNAEKLAVEDLDLYINSGLYRQVFKVWPENGEENWGWRSITSEGTPFLKWAVDHNLSAKGSNFRTGVTSDTGKGVLSYNYNRNLAGYSSRMFPTPYGLKYAPGEATMFIDGNNHKVILTSPKVDILDFLSDLKSENDPLYSQLIPLLSSTIDKNIMKDFWINSRKILRPGTYLSGDNGMAPLGSSLINAFKKKQLYKTNFTERPLSEQFVRRTGLSPDSYSSIIRLGNRDGSLRWGEGFVKWNNSAIKNKYISDAFKDYMDGKISKEAYENIFNTWSTSIGGQPLKWLYNAGAKPYPIHPHPYIYSKAKGGTF